MRSSATRHKCRNTAYTTYAGIYGPRKPILNSRKGHAGIRDTSQVPQHRLYDICGNIWTIETTAPSGMCDVRHLSDVSVFHMKVRPRVKGSSELRDMTDILTDASASRPELSAVIQKAVCNESRRSIDLPPSHPPTHSIAHIS